MSKPIIPKNETEKTKMLESAIAYARFFHWSVFPLHSIVKGQCTCGRLNCGSPGKHPRVKSGVKEATTDEGVIKNWFTKWPNSNIGAATGEKSGFIAVDIDPRHGGEASLDEWISEYGHFKTVEAITGSKGKHILFNYPGQLGNRANVKPGIDIRGDGGYIVLAPSNHISGNQYEWELSSRPGEVRLSDMPEWLLKELQETTKSTIKKPSSHWSHIIQGVGEGERNNSAASLAGYLLRRRLDASVAYEIMLMWNDRNNPPMSQDDLDKTYMSILKKEVDRLGRG
ncbi:DNA primase [Halobacillus andaensis]|uniref:DNA primase n=1 Tax=Halobacillus andaensis TaxID=1176239 RepID=A0A917B7F2_HALAA|nr:bifunctional DNA primase/polymerase [Halobacillus andaensis]MBP2006018.1 hypothetical protein [Halobacillus andaensis]GGF24258.1 DNA primase [Halobacillus andaensis]